MTNPGLANGVMKERPLEFEPKNPLLMHCNMVWVNSASLPVKSSTALQLRLACTSGADPFAFVI